MSVELPVCSICNLVVHPYSPHLLSDEEIVHIECNKKREKDRRLREFLKNIPKGKITINPHFVRR